MNTGVLHFVWPLLDHASKHVTYLRPKQPLIELVSKDTVATISTQNKAVETASKIVITRPLANNLTFSQLWAYRFAKSNLLRMNLVSTRALAVHRVGTAKRLMLQTLCASHDR